LKLTNIYGASKMAIYTPTNPNLASPVINIINDTCAIPLPGSYNLYPGFRVDGDKLTKTFGLTNIYGGGLGNGTNEVEGVAIHGDILTGYVKAHPVINLGGLDKTINRLGYLEDAPNRRNIAIVRGNVYGGGEAAPVEGNTEVTLYSSRTTGEDAGHHPIIATREHDTTHVKGSIFGGGLGQTATVTACPQVVIGSDTPTPGRTYAVTILGNVYGGGSAAPVVGNPTVVTRSLGDNSTNPGTTQCATKINGNVYGGGLGPTAVTTGNTTVDIRGNRTTVEGNVYGGGNAGILNGSTDVIIGDYE
jgi:hypothetical protein